MRALFAALRKPRNRVDAHALATAARVSIGAGAELDALARLIQLFPDERVIAVVRAGVAIGIVTADVEPRPDAQVVADIMTPVV